MKIHNNKLKAIHALLSKTGLKDNKDDIVREYTGGRTTHSSMMRDDEAASLIGYLQSVDPERIKAEKMKRKIISMAHQMGWKLESGRIDIFRVNAWCQKYSHFHKPLDAHRLNELPTLVTQFERAYQDFIKKQ